MHGFLQDSAILAQTEALLAISEELALTRPHLQNPQVRTQPGAPAELGVSPISFGRRQSVRYMNCRLGSTDSQLAWRFGGADYG